MFENQSVTVRLFVLFLVKVTFEVIDCIFIGDQSFYECGSESGCRAE